jgi:hypothetical protein
MANQHKEKLHPADDFCDSSGRLALFRLLEFILFHSLSTTLNTPKQICSEY